MTSDTALPLACVPGAIAPGDRPAHFTLLTRLFSVEARERREQGDGYAFRFEASAWPDLARWVDNERHCCPFLNFSLELSPAEGDIWVRLTGPSGVHAFLDAELPPMAMASGR